MVVYRVFIDGSAGTTGLRIFERFQTRQDVELLLLSGEDRKNLDARRAMLDRADISFLCLPDAAARELCAVAPPGARILDTSTAHRTNPAWVYGLPELSAAQRCAIETANRVAVPGCHATGFICLAAPLVQRGIAASDYPFTAHSVTGYSGGGKQMIAQYQDEHRPDTYASPRQYALGQTHKHLPEMQQYAGLAYAPIFNPIVADFYSGMVVMVPLHTRLLSKSVTAQDVAQTLADFYAGQTLITVHPFGQQPDDGTLAASAMAGSCGLELFVFGTDQQIVLAARYDNLGKGASGAAIQCMNLMLGLAEDTGL